MTKGYKFRSPGGKEFSLELLLEEIVSYLADDDNSQYRLVIGSDSHERMISGVKQANYVTAVVMHRVGKGGRYFWSNGTHEKVHSLRQKIYTETTLSLAVAQQLVPALNEKLQGKKNWDLEIHIDVGRVGDTREMIKEVVSMVIGNGYTAKTKPESFAASSVADKYT